MMRGLGVFIAVVIASACPAVHADPGHDPGHSEPIGAPRVEPLPSCDATVRRDQGFTTAPGNTASASGAILVDGELVSAPADAVLARGRAIHAAWRADHAIVIASSPTGTTWSAPVRADEPADCEPSTRCPADPAIAAIGTTVFLGYAGDAIGTRIRVSRDGGVTFDAPVTPLAGTQPALAAGSEPGDGRLHVVALRGGPLGVWGSADHAIEYTASLDGGRTFARPVVVSNRDDMLPLRDAQPAIAVDSRRGWIYVAYVRGGHDRVWQIVIAASKDKGVTWARTALADHCSIRVLPSLAVDPTTGAVHVAWFDSVGGGRFAHASCPAGAARCAEIGSIGEPFALSLDAVRGKITIDDKRRLLHAVWSLGDGTSHALAKLR